MIGERIKELRLEKGISQKQLADILDVSRPSVTKYERNERNPEYEVLVKMSDYFDVSLDYIFGRSDIRSMDQLVSYSEVTGIEQLVERSEGFTKVGLEKLMSRIYLVLKLYLENQSFSEILTLQTYLEELYALEKYMVTVVKKGHGAIKKEHIKEIIQRRSEIEKIVDRLFSCKFED